MATLKYCVSSVAQWSTSHSEVAFKISIFLKFRFSEKATKIWRNLPQDLNITKQRPNLEGDSVKFCGLLRISVLYHRWNYSFLNNHEISCEIIDLIVKVKFKWTYAVTRSLKAWNIVKGEAILNNVNRVTVADIESWFVNKSEALKWRQGHRSILIAIQYNSKNILAPLCTGL